MKLFYDVSATLTIRDSLKLGVEISEVYAVRLDMIRLFIT